MLLAPLTVSMRTHWRLCIVHTRTLTHAASSTHNARAVDTMIMVLLLLVNVLCCCPQRRLVR